MSESPEKPERTAAAPSSRAWRAAQVALCAVAAALLALWVGRTADYFWFAITCPYEIEYGEGVVLQYAVNIARGDVIYNDFNHYPYIAATYPPLYPLLVAAGVKLFGVKFVFGRILSSLATLGTALFIWLILRRAGRNRLAAGLGAALFVAAPIVTWWGPVVRVDALAVFLGVASLYCAMRGGRWLVPAVALMVLAVYTRQSEMAPAVATVAYLAWGGKRKQAALVGAAWAGVAAALFVTLQLTSQGWFYRHIVVANQNLWELETLSYWWLKYVLPRWPFPFALGLVGAILVFAGAARQPHEAATAAPHPLRLLALYYVLTMLVSLTAGKVGATVNYMLAPLAASCVTAGIACEWLAERTRFRLGKVAWVAAWALLAGPPVYHIAQPAADQYAPYRLSREKILQGSKEALAMVRSVTGDVLSEDTGLLVLAGKPVLLDSHKMTSMFRDGNWNQRPLIEDIKRRRFALVVTRWDPVGGATDRWGTCGNYRWSIGMGRAIMRNYYLVKHTGFLYVTAPADGIHPTCDELHSRLVEQRERRLR